MTERPLHYVAQAILFALFAVFIGYFSTAPQYRHLEEGQALLRISFRHPGKPIADCRVRTPEELASVPLHLRTELDCERERSPVHLQVEVDGELLYDEWVAPSGLRKDGASSTYQRMPIAAGEHLLKVRINDDRRVAGFTYEGERRVQLTEGQVVLVDFIADKGGVIIR
ncbi:MAG: hypothetical protein WCY32_05590 [Burkholderiaceae bacterium]